MSTFATDSFDGTVPHSETPHPFDGDDGGYVGYDDSQQFEDFQSQPPIYGGEYAADENGNELGGGFYGSDGPILPPPVEMEVEEGFALREWRRQNAMLLEEKEKREKELLHRIIEEANEYKVEFYRKREITLANNKSTNREKEKVILAGQEKFHAEADKNYWKSIADLIPNEVPAIEKKRGKKDQEKKPGIVIIQGPKPGKPTELSRMRQILVKLKHSTPLHLKLVPEPAAAPAKDTKASDATDASTAIKAASVMTTPQAVAVA